MKKQLLIVIDSLGSGGAEKSLINLLNFLDFDTVDVDLLLFRRGGINEVFLPPQVNILPVVSLQKPESFWGKCRYSFKRFFHYISSRLFPPKNCNDYTVNFWNHLFEFYTPLKKRYDVAFAYAQRIPTIFVATKVNAEKKYAWMNVTIHHDQQLQQFYAQFLQVFTKVICVSDDVYESVLTSYPAFKEKLEVIYDIINPEFIYKLAEKPVNIPHEHNCTNILTVARLNYEQKGYDILLKVCFELRRRNIPFHWYALGDGPKIEEIKDTIRKYNLQDCFTLLGIDPNPYPYYKISDIYVQTSRYEGYGLAIGEARLLNIPVVTTAYDCVGLQIKNGINGLVTSFDVNEIADAIQSLIENHTLYEKIVLNLEKEKKGNIDEFDKIRKLIFP